MTGQDVPAPAGASGGRPKKEEKKKEDKKKEDKKKEDKKKEDKKKEEKKDDKEDSKKQTRLGLEARKEDNLPDWYSQVT